VIVQEASRAGPLARSILPGHSYLITVIDPDRNVRPTAKDTVLVSAEVESGAAGVAAPRNDVEVLILSETADNSGVFRGFVDTQPGPGRMVQAVLEVLPMQQVCFGYVDVADAKGARNVIRRLRLPVISGVLTASALRPPAR